MNTKGPARPAVSYDVRAGLRHLRRDAALARLIDAVGPFDLRVKQDGSHFAYLQRAIIYQQLSGAAAGTIHRRFLEHFGGAPDAPTLLRASAAALRRCGVSRQKLGYLRDLARRVDSGEVRLGGLGRKDDDAIIEELTRIKGIGRWTVQMFLLFRLGRPDVLSELDLGIRKGVALCLGRGDLPPPKEVARHGERWAPYRSMASWYLWRGLEVVTPG